MKLLVVFALIGVITGDEEKPLCYSPVETDYHNNIGIPKASRIKAAEQVVGHAIRIAGGEPANLGQYPFFGGLLISMRNGSESVCGSTLLSNTRAVTAAHCWQTLYSHAKEFLVVLGSTRLFSGGTRVYTRNVEVHKDYNMTTLANDIAIILLPWVDFNSNIHSIPLATGGGDYVGAWAQAIGFGRISDSIPSPLNRVLSHVYVQVIPNGVCAQTYGDTVTDSTICVGTNGGRSTCNGDSGGPLVVEHRLIGVTSFGHQGDCQRNNPTGFSRVTCFASWLQDRLK